MFVGSVYEERFTGIIGQMLNKVTDYQRYIDDDNFFMQEKYDGERRLVRYKEKETISINKKRL
jgi:ATP-dependent DNA ligase